jgi:hypothetical protein
MLKYAEAAAPDAVAVRVVQRLGRRIVRESGFAQVVICIDDIRKISPFRSQKIVAYLIDRHTVKRHENAARPGVVEG